MNLNKMMLAGNISREPELKTLPSGTHICEFGVAVNRVWKDKDGTKKGEVTFIEVMFFGKMAENVAKFFSKGTPIFVEGRLSQDSWEDKETGKKRSKTKVIGEAFEFVGGTKKEGKTSDKQTPQDAPETPDDDDIPF